MSLFHSRQAVDLRNWARDLRTPFHHCCLTTNWADLQVSTRERACRKNPESPVEGKRGGGLQPACLHKYVAAVVRFRTCPMYMSSLLCYPRHATPESIHKFLLAPGHGMHKCYPDTGSSSPAIPSHRCAERRAAICQNTKYRLCFRVGSGADGACVKKMMEALPRAPADRKSIPSSGRGRLTIILSHRNPSRNPCLCSPFSSL